MKTLLLLLLASSMSAQISVYPVGAGTVTGSANLTTAGRVLCTESAGAVTECSGTGSVFGGTFMGFGGATSSFPALKRSSAILQVRLGDDSADAALNAGAITASTSLRVVTATTADSSADTLLAASGTTKRPLVVQGVASQAADFFQVQSSAGTAFAGVTSVGSVYVTNGTANTSYLAQSGAFLSVAAGLKWSSTADGAASVDTGLHRNAAGVVEVNNGSAGTHKTIMANAFLGGGSTPSVATCGTIGTGSKNSAGFITSDTTGSCVSVLTFNGYTAPTGWSCAISNATTANLMTQTGSTTTTATFTGTTVANDVLRYNCLPY